MWGNPTKSNQAYLNPRPGKTMDEKTLDNAFLRDIAQEHFKEAILQTKQIAFIDPQTDPRSKAIAKLAANYIKWNCDEAY